MGTTIEGSNQFKLPDKSMSAEGKALVRAEAESAGALMDRSSMKWNAKNSNEASTQGRYNVWELKKTPTSPRSAQMPASKDMVTSTVLGGM